MKIFTFCFLILFLQNCTKKQTKRISFNQFTIEIPNGWKEIRISGIDSEVGAIVTEENDTIHFDYGLTQILWRKILSYMTGNF